MLLEELQAKALQTFHFQRNRFVRSAHLMPKLEQERCDPAHAAAGNTDEVNPMMLARKKSRQSELNAHGRHSAAVVYLPIVSTKGLRALLVARRAPLHANRSS